MTNPDKPAEGRSTSLPLEGGPSEAKTSFNRKVLEAAKKFVPKAGQIFDNELKKKF